MIPIMQFAFVLLSLVGVVFGDQKLCGVTDNTGPRDGYIINNNLWGAGGAQGQQCTFVDHISNRGVAWHTTWQWSGNEYGVKSYANSGLVLNEKKLLSNIQHIPTSAKWSYKNAQSTVSDVSYDLFTAQDANHDPSSGDYELMIWLAKYGDSSHIQPIGQKIGNAAIGGHNWELWYGVGDNTAMQTYSFVAHGTINDYKGDIMQFFHHLTKNHNFPAKTQHLISKSPHKDKGFAIDLTFPAVQFGTEPKTGGEATMKVSEWSASVH